MCPEIAVPGLEGYAADGNLDAGDNVVPAPRHDAAEAKAEDPTQDRAVRDGGGQTPLDADDDVEPVPRHDAAETKAEDPAQDRAVQEEGVYDGGKKRSTSQEGYRDGDGLRADCAEIGAEHPRQQRCMAAAGGGMEMTAAVMKERTAAADM